MMLSKLYRSQFSRESRALQQPLLQVVVTCLSVLLLVGPASADDNPVLAEYDGGEKITMEDFAERFPALVSWFGLGAKEEHVQESLDSMIFDELLAREAQESGIAKRPKIANQINRILATAVLAEKMPPESLAVSDKEVKKYYKENSKKYTKPERFQVSHILVDSKDEAKRIAKEIKAGKDFEALAKAHSDDPFSAEIGGSLGWVYSKTFLPSLTDEATDLETGEVSGPVESDFGYHILRMDNRPHAELMPYEEVKKEVNRRVKEEKQLARVKEIREELWDKYDVEVDRKVLAKAVTDKEGAVKKAPGPVSFPERAKDENAQPELLLISEALDLGKIKAETVSRDLLLKNISEKDITIKRVGTTCKCATAKIDPLIIKPGAVGKLTLEYDPTMFEEKGETSKVIYIDSTDAVKPRRVVRMQAEIVKAKG